jgi:hypothetical protein
MWKHKTAVFLHLCSSIVISWSVRQCQPLPLLSNICIFAGKSGAYPSGARGDCSVHIERAQLIQNNSITSLHIIFTRFYIVLVYILVVVYIKHSSFWPLTNVNPN